MKQSLDEYIISCELRIIGYIAYNPKTSNVLVTLEDFTHKETIALFHIIYDEFIVRNHGTDMKKVLGAILKSEKYKWLMSSSYIGRAFGETEYDNLLYNEECFIDDQRTLMMWTMERSSQNNRSKT